MQVQISKTQNIINFMTEFPYFPFFFPFGRTRVPCKRLFDGPQFCVVQVVSLQPATLLVFFIEQIKKKPSIPQKYFKINFDLSKFLSVLCCSYDLQLQWITFDSFSPIHHIENNLL